MRSFVAEVRSHSSHTEPMEVRAAGLIYRLSSVNSEQTDLCDANSLRKYLRVQYSIEFASKKAKRIVTLFSVTFIASSKN